MFDFSALQNALNNLQSNLQKMTASLPTEPGIYVDGKKVDSLPSVSTGTHMIVVNGQVVSNDTFYLSDKMAAMPGQAVIGQLSLPVAGQLDSVIARA